MKLLLLLMILSGCNNSNEMEMRISRLENNVHELQLDNFKRDYFLSEEGIKDKKACISYTNTSQVHIEVRDKKTYISYTNTSQVHTEVTGYYDIVCVFYLGQEKYTVPMSDVYKQLGKENVK